MEHIGNFGHSAILFPASLALIGFLLWLGRRADGFAFFAALVVCLVGTLIAKLAFEACESGAPTFGIESPSGHVSFSSAFYGCLALIIGAQRPFWQRLVLYGGVVLLALLIGASRIAVEAHNLPDVVAGLTIGSLSILLFQTLRGPPRALVLSPAAIVIGAPAVAILLGVILVFARHWTPEPLIAHIATRLGLMLSLCRPLS